MKKINKNISFVEHLSESLKSPEFANAFQEEKEKLRIALKIAELRKEKGLSQAELAQELGTTQSVISRLENASYENYTIRTLIKIAHILNVRLVIDFQ